MTRIGNVSNYPHKLTSACSCLSDGLAFPLISVATHIWSVCRYQLLSDTMFNNFQAVIVCCWKPRIFSHNTLTEMYNTDVSPPPPHSSDSKFSFYFMLHLLLPLVLISVSSGLLLFFNEIWKCLRLFHCVLVLYFWNTSLVDLANVQHFVFYADCFWQANVCPEQNKAKGTCCCYIKTYFLLKRSYLASATLTLMLLFNLNYSCWTSNIIIILPERPLNTLCVS